MTTFVDRAAVAAWLRSSAAEGPLKAAGAAVTRSPRDPLAAGMSVRRQYPGLDGSQAAAVLEQAGLRRLAAERYGLVAGDLLLTRDGLEQATRPEVAQRRAALLTESGVLHVVDATAGLGFDTRAFLAAGLAVTSVERDAVTAAFLEHNCPAARIVEADITAPGTLEELVAGLTESDAVFVDPARRDPAGPRDSVSGRSRPERDPERWSPPWSFVAGIPHARVAAKVAPAFSPPTGWHAEWTSVHRTVVECSVYSWPAFDVARRAVIIETGNVQVVDADDQERDIPIADAPGRWVHEVDPAVIRSSAVAALVGAHQGLHSLGPGSSWLTSDGVPDAGPALRSHRVVAEIRGSDRDQRRQLSALGVSRLSVKSRDVDADPSVVLRRLALAEGPGQLLVMTRLGNRPITLLVEPAIRRSA